MKVRWGVLGAAGIATKHVIPAMQRCTHARIAAIASRDRARAEAVAAQFRIERAHGSYEELLADEGVDAVYIPLPNNLHVAWSIRAIESGKHVLCEKPVGLDAREAGVLASAAARRPALKVMEAFMYRFHPQWQRTRQLVADGAIGEVRAIQTFFSYFNVDPQNVRNIAEAGGGALMDIGCYGVSVARFIFGREPGRVIALSERDPAFGTDRTTAATLDFGGLAATFTCATQLARHQRVDVVGTEGRIDIEIPFNAPIDRSTSIWLQRGTKLEKIAFARCNQYTIQGDCFSESILNGTDVPFPIADAVGNMQAIDAVRESAARGLWVDVPQC